MDELMAKRGRLKVQLEKVLHRIAEFPFFSELDMIEQVGFCLACLKRFLLNALLQYKDIKIHSPFFFQYLADVKAVQKLLQEVENEINFIHYEEDFYNLDQTSYPEVDVIKDSTDVYHKLFGFILNWQHTESRCGFIFNAGCVNMDTFF